MPEPVIPLEAQPPSAEGLAQLARARGLDRAAADLEAGRVWKARDRFQGAFIRGRHDQAALDMLATVLYLMHDLPEAGRFWYLTDRDDEAAQRARAAFEERYRGPAEMARRLPARTPLDEYPEDARVRLDRLGAAPWPPLSRWVSAEPSPLSRRDRLLITLGLVLVALLLVAMLLGLLQIGAWVVDSIRSILS
jgi:hypothetical protein